MANSGSLSWFNYSQNCWSASAEEVQVSHKQATVSWLRCCTSGGAGLNTSSEQTDSITFSFLIPETPPASFHSLFVYWVFFSGKLDVFSYYPNSWKNVTFSKTWKLARVHVLDRAFFVLVILKISLDHFASVEKEAFKNSTSLLTTSIPVTNLILQSL